MPLFQRCKSPSTRVRLQKRPLYVTLLVFFFVHSGISNRLTAQSEKKLQVPAVVVRGFHSQKRDSAEPVRHNLSVYQIPTVGTMVLNRPDLLVSLLNSIDHPVSHFVIVHNLDSNNDTNKETAELLTNLELKPSELVGHHHIAKLTVVRHDQNLGFSAGVNRILLSSPNSPYWLIVNNDVGFRPGSLREIASRLRHSVSKEERFCAWAMVGEPVGPFSAFVLTQLAVQKVGFWDENFWPVYGEDCDYEARLVRASCPMVFEQNTSRIARHVGSASWRTTRGTSSLSDLVGRGKNNFDYIESKWGSNVCHARRLSAPYMETVGYGTPFNRVNASLAYWNVDIERRLSRGGPSTCVLCSSEEANNILNSQMIANR